MSRKIICGVFIFLQIICVFITPWVIAFDNVNGVWLRLFEIPFYLLYYALLILGIIFLIIFYKQNQINSCMVLEDYKIIAIRGIEYPINDPASDLFLNNNVVGHYVSVDIGTLERFSGFYIPGTIGFKQT